MDRPNDHLLRRILAAAASEAGGPDVPRLIGEARAEAAEEVKAILKSAMKAALLRAAADRLDATSQILDSKALSPDKVRTPDAELPAGATACYLYAITAADRDRWPADLVGVDGAHPPEAVHHDDLHAIVSHVSLDEFGQAGLNERASDAQWIEQKVRAHDAVIKRAMGSGQPVIPCRFCTVLRSTDDVRRLLDVHGDAIRSTLAALDGKQEWGVKVFARRPAEVAREIAESLVGGDETAGNGARAGTAYLQRRRHEDGLRDDVQRAARSRALACHEELAALADEAIALPRRRRGNGAGRGVTDEPVLNAACLVTESRVEAFLAAVAAMQGRDGPLGLAFEVTGPWPPYNFVRLDLSLGGEA